MEKKTKEPRRKKEYKTPVVTSYGTLERLTRGAGNTGDDGILGSRHKA
jgi:hypothetical protein